MTKKTAAKKPARSARRPGIRTAKTPAAKLAKPTKAPPPAPEKKAPAAKPPVRTMVGAAVELIKAGKSNNEVRAMLVADFGLPPAHAFYASWYRSYAIKKGLVTREFARAHAGEPAPRRAPAAAK